jgi:hypothetical protein
MAVIIKGNFNVSGALDADAMMELWTGEYADLSCFKGKLPPPKKPDAHGGSSTSCRAATAPQRARRLADDAACPVKSSFAHTTVRISEDHRAVAFGHDRGLVRVLDDVERCVVATLGDPKWRRFWQTDGDHALWARVLGFVF